MRTGWHEEAAEAKAFYRGYSWHVRDMIVMTVHIIEEYLAVCGDLTPTLVIDQDTAEANGQMRSGVSCILRPINVQQKWCLPWVEVNMLVLYLSPLRKRLAISMSGR